VSNYIETLDYIPVCFKAAFSRHILNNCSCFDKMKLWLWTEKNAETGFIQE